MKALLSTLLLSIASTSFAQTTPGKLSFALPEHPGHLSLDQGNFKISELSAKPNGNEFGIRAEDGDLHLLAFLFVWPEKPHLTAETCRDEMLTSEGPKALAAASDRLSFKSAGGTDIAIVLMFPKDGSFSTVRAFVASGDLCGDISFTEAQPVTTQIVPMDKTKSILNTLQFDPQAKPTFRDAFAYATVEWQKEQIKGSALAYADALKLVDASDDPLKWRRVTTDQLCMALGMSGDLQQSRAVNEAAIKRDPNYPLYYYDLACADAEEGKADAARIHLQQAFDREANTLPGESLPDPAKDDSILKLKDNKEFWTFVQTLSPKAN
jgi:tetratricopeptide (TPR) repeat protein